MRPGAARDRIPVSGCRASEVPLRAALRGTSSWCKAWHGACFTLVSMRKPSIILVGALLLTAGGLRATDAGSVPDPRQEGLSPTERLEALVARVQYEQTQVRTLEADFVQHQESDLLLEPQESRGTFYYAAPDRVRWEYVSPNPITLLIDDKEMTTWYRDLDRAEQLKVGRYSDQVLKYLGAGSSLGALLEYFTVRAAYPKDPTKPYRLELTPKFERIAKRLKSLTIWLDPEGFMPERLRYEGSDGDTTEFRFQDFRVNNGIPADRFKLDLPATVELRVLAPGRSSR